MQICTTVTVDAVVLGKFQAACISKITIELTTFLPCIVTNKTEYNSGCFMASDVKCSRSIDCDSDTSSCTIAQH